jgi:hypothetical protein
MRGAGRKGDGAGSVSGEYTLKIVCFFDLRGSGRISLALSAEPLGGLASLGEPDNPDGCRSGNGEPSRLPSGDLDRAATGDDARRGRSACTAGGSVGDVLTVRVPGTACVRATGCFSDGELRA